MKKIGLGGRVRRVSAAVPDHYAVEALRTCDVIIRCVDTLFARSDLQELASRHLIPYIDIGATVRVVPELSVSDPRIVVAGNVFTFVPGSFCLRCCGFLSSEKIEAEQNGPTRGYFEKNRQEAQVVSFNGVRASQAVTEVLQLLTGFGGVGLRQADLRMPSASTVRGYKKFDGVAGSLQEWGGVRRPDCPHCGNILGAGDVVFAPIPAGRTAAALLAYPSIMRLFRMPIRVQPRQEIPNTAVCQRNARIGSTIVEINGVPIRSQRIAARKHHVLHIAMTFIFRFRRKHPRIPPN